MNRDRKQKDHGKRLAAIDVGSNSVLLAIISCDTKGRFTVLKEDSRTPRIADYSDPLKRPDSIRRLILALKGFKKLCVRFGAKKIFCMGTEALRRNPDKKKIIGLLERETGLRIEVIGPERESRLSFISATEELQKCDGDRMVLDIGAASTEIALRRRGKFLPRSLRLGCLTLAKKLGFEYPLTGRRLSTAKELIRLKLKYVPKAGRRTDLLGVGGTITSIPSILSKLKCYDPLKLDLKRISKGQLDRLIEKLGDKDIEGLKRIPGMPKGREDILLPGLLILSEIMNAYGSSSITVRNRGIRFGILFDHLRRLYPSARFRMT